MTTGNLRPVASFVNFATPADNDPDAEHRFQAAKRLDPFPQIPPSLLNSSDIYDYVRMTGLLWPFEMKYLKTASYEVELGGRVVLWDDKGNRSDRVLADGEPFDLDKNSIAFVTTKQKFRIPEYIALRFNLRITNVHKGILLGTGPLVDPGFVGSLLIPLHNLTTNRYTLRVGHPLIWVEFTKLSPSSVWSPNHQAGTEPANAPRPYGRVFQEQTGDYVSRYLIEAANGYPIRSAIPETMREASEKAEKAERHARWVRNFGLIALVALLVGVVAVVIPTWQIVGHNAEVAARASEKVVSLEKVVIELQKRLESSQKSRHE